MRITQKMLATSALNGMQTNLRRLSESQRQAVTTKRVNKPEDDPFAVEQSLGFRSKIKASETARGNIGLSRDWLSATDEALDHVGSLLNRAQSLALQGASDTLGDDGRQAVSIEVDEILEEMMAVANTRHGDDYLFSGFKLSTPAYAETRDVQGQISSIAANGVISGQIVREVEPGVNMVVNVSGDSVFPGIFNTLINLRDALVQTPYDPAALETAITDIKSGLDTTLDVRAAVGTKMRRLESATARMENAELGMQELLSKAEDADMTKVITDLNQQKFVYETALAVNGRVLNTSLLDYLR